MLLGGERTGFCVDEGVVLRLVSGALSLEERREVEAHAANCADCLDLIAGAAQGSSRPAVDELDSGPRAAGDGDLKELDRVGRFDVLGPLGAGGMGIVRMARCRETGRLVALKRVRGVEAGAVAALRREIHALSELQHPGIAPIIDQGLVDGLPFYAMELIEGETLQQRIERLPPRDATTFAALLPVLGIVRDLCETLAFLHEHELVHRDLKPRNVLLRQNGDVPVLVDFGLATRRQEPGRESIDSWAGASGTQRFVAPEQLLGDLVDARADLYSLGGVLYQIVTGTPPPPLVRAPTANGKPGSGAGAWVERSLAPPSSAVRGLDAPAAALLDTLILRLLALEPRARVGCAQDVARVLDQLGAKGGAIPVTARQKHIYRPRLVGRDADIAALAALANRCYQGRGGRAFIAGVSGHGKTRLAMEVAVRARRLRLDVVTASCVPLDPRATPVGPSGAEGSLLMAFRTFLTAVADRARQGGEALADRLIGDRGKILSVYEPELARTPGQHKYPDPPELSSEATRIRLIAALEHTLQEAAHDHPLLLVIDDWQWADALSIEVLESLDHRFFERNPVLILGTYRSDEIEPALGARLQAMSEEHLPLRRLGDGPLGEMIADMLAYPDCPRALVEPLVREANGNPFFLIEYVRLAVEEGWLQRDRNDEGRWRLTADAPVLRPALAGPYNLPVPRPLRTLAERRLATLSPNARAVAAFAALLGRTFPSELLSATPRLPPQAVPGTMDELFARQIVEHDPTAEYRFVHDQFREAAYHGIALDELPAWHRAAALALEAQSSSDAADARGVRAGQAASLAHHFAMAGDRERERFYRRLAGDQAFRGGAYRDAIRHLSRCLELGDATAGLVEELTLERQLAEAHFGVGDIASSRSRLEAMTARAGMPRPEGNAATLRAALADLFTYLAGSTAAWLAQPPSVHDRAVFTEVARAHERLAHVLYFENETIGVASSSMRALAAAARVGASPELSRAYANLSIAAALAPARPLAWLLRSRARAVAAQVGDAPAAAWAKQLEGVYQAGVGGWKPACAALEGSAEEWRGIGDRRRWEECLTLLGMALFQAGDAGRASAMRDELLGLSESIGSEQTRGWALIGQAEDRLLANKPAEALAALDDAARLGSAVRLVEQLWMHGLRASAHLALDAQGEAELSLERGLALEAGTIPVAFYVLEGYAGFAEVATTLAAARLAQGQDATRAMRSSVRAVSRLARFARVFPIARARTGLWRGALAALRGDEAAANRAWRAGLRHARKLGRLRDAAALERRLASAGLR